MSSGPAAAAPVAALGVAEYSMLKTPLEFTSQRFRRAQKETTRVVTELQKEGAGAGAGAGAGGQGDGTAGQVLEAVREYRARVARLQEMVRTTGEEEAGALRSFRKRVEYLQRKGTQAGNGADEQEEVNGGKDEGAEENGEERKREEEDQGGEEEAVRVWNAFRLNRFTVDFLLRHGMLRTVESLAQEASLTEFVDVEVRLYAQARLVEDTLLHEHSVAAALDWCAENASKLRRVNSSLEFELRQQQFIDMVKSGQRAGALTFSATHLAPSAHANPQRIQELMGLLAFPDLNDLDKIPEHFQHVLQADRWDVLVKMFRSDFLKVYGVAPLSPLTTCLQGGLVALRTEHCGPATSVAAAGSPAEQKMEVEQPTGRHRTRRRTNNDMEDNGGLEGVGMASAPAQADEEDAGDEEAPEERLLDARGLPLPVSPLSNPTFHQQQQQEQLQQLQKQQQQQQQQQRETLLQHDSAARAAECPVCSDAGWHLAASLPQPYRTHSTLICRVTGTIMDEHNPPVALPSGHVFSRHGVELLTKHGMVRCPITGQSFPESDLRTVYVA